MLDTRNFTDLEKLQYLHRVLQEIQDILHDDMVGIAIGFVEDLRDPHLNVASPKNAYLAKYQH